MIENLIQMMGEQTECAMPGQVLLEAGQRGLLVQTAMLALMIKSIDPRPQSRIDIGETGNFFIDQ